MKQDIQNNINSLEEIERILGQAENEDKKVAMIQSLITTHEQQAYEKAKMELEVEIGLQKFGQLMKEKEAIIQQARRNAVEEFAEWHNDIPDYAIEAVCKVDKEDIEKFLKRKIST